MKIKEITLSATIPTQQYANLMPSITVEVDDDDVEGAKALAISHIASISQRFAEPGKQLVDGSQAIVKDIFGQSCYFDEPTHTYTNSKGQVYLSASQYAKRFGKGEFASDAIAGKMSAKSGVEVQHILDAWKAKADVSSGFGTAMHLALDNYEKFKDMAKTLDKPYDIHNHPIINKIVVEFYKGREKEKAITEALVLDHELRKAARIDRLLLIDKEKKVCRVQDWKFNAELTPEKKFEYWNQLSFSASILIAKGWTVQGLDLFHYDGEWHDYKSKVLEVKV